jgi:hypothetical protein
MEQRNGKPNQENAGRTGPIGMAVCWDSLGLGRCPALEERPEAFSIPSGGNHTRGPKQLTRACGSEHQIKKGFM